VECEFYPKSTRAPPKKAGKSKPQALEEGQSGNPSGRPKDLANFGEILMKEFYKTVIANLGGKTVKKMQGEIVAQQMVKNASVEGAAAMAPLLKFIEAMRRAKRREAMKAAEGSVEITGTSKKHILYQEMMHVASVYTGRPTRTASPRRRPVSRSASKATRLCIADIKDVVTAVIKSFYQNVTHDIELQAD
jgi:hypothetical protein